MRIRDKKSQVFKLRDLRLNKSVNKFNENKSNLKLKTPVNNKQYPLILKVH